MKEPEEINERRATLSVAALAHAIQDGLSATIVVLLPVLAQAFGLSLTEVGILKGLKNTVQGILEVLSGVASDWFGDRALLIFGLVMSGIGYLAFFVAGGVPVVAVCLVVVGIGTAFQHAQASALVSRAYADRGRRGALGLYNSSGDAGKLVFATSFSLAIGAGFAWSAIAALFGLVSLIGALVALRLLRNAVADAERNEGPGGRARGWGIVNRRAFTLLVGAVFLDTLVQSGALTFIAFLMLDKGAPLSIATFAATAVLVGGMAGKAVCGFLAERIGAKPAFALVQTLTAIGLFTTILMPLAAAYVLLPILGVVLQGSSSITYSTVGDLVQPDRASRGFALIYGLTSFAAVAGPVLLGLLGDAYGIETTIAALALVALFSMTPLLIARLDREPVRA